MCESCSHLDEAPPCRDCMDISDRMPFVKAWVGPSDPEDTKRKVIREIIALAEDEGLSRTDICQRGPHFLVEYRRSYRDDSMEEWVSFKKSQKCQDMGK